jgi:hypothetical protein
MGKSNVCRILMEKPGGKRPLGRPERTSEDNIKMDLRELGWGSIDWINLAQEMDQWRAPANTEMNLRVLLQVEKFLSSWANGGFSMELLMTRHYPSLYYCELKVDFSFCYWNLSVFSITSIFLWAQNLLQLQVLLLLLIKLLLLLLLSPFSTGTPVCRKRIL